MTRPLEELRADHAAVRTGLGVLAAIARHVRIGGQFPAEDTAATLRFLREFMVATHFRKENGVVWPAITLRADAPTAAAVGDLMRLQAQATELITTLVVFWEPAGELTEDERVGFADTIDALVACVHSMQETEERLFGACVPQVPADDRIDWIEQFADIEHERVSRASWAPKLQQLAADWIG